VLEGSTLGTQRLGLTIASVYTEDLGFSIKGSILFSNLVFQI